MDIIKKIDETSVERINQGKWYIYCLKVSLEKKVFIRKVDVKNYQGRCKEHMEKYIKDCLKDMVVKSVLDYFESK